MNMKDHHRILIVAGAWLIACVVGVFSLLGYCNRPTLADKPVYRATEMAENEKLNSENSAIVVAASAWNTPTTKDLPMDLALAVEFGAIIQRYIDRIEELEKQLENK